MVAMPWRSVVSADRFELNLSPGDQCELYDLENDPHEQGYLYDVPVHRGQVRDMAARIRVWRPETHFMAGVFLARRGSSKSVTTTSSLTVSKTAQLNCRSLVWSRPSPVEPGLMTRTPPIRRTTC